MMWWGGAILLDVFTLYIHKQYEIYKMNAMKGADYG